MRILPTLAGFLAISAVAYAQPTPPPPDMLPPYPGQQGAPPPAQMAPSPGEMPPPGAEAPPPRPAHAHLTGKARFEAANLTHDGRLTIEQAQQAGWKGVARHFQDIDRDHKGYVTLQDIHEWHLAHKAAKRQAANPPPPPPPQ